MNKSIIKTTIASGKYNSIFSAINDIIFEDDVYHPDRDMPNRRAILLLAFVPDFEIDEENGFDDLYSDEVEEIFAYLEENSKQYVEIKASMDRWIEHRLRMIEGEAMSLTDYALAKFVETLNNKVKGLDITDEGVKAVTEAVNNVNSDNFAGDVVDAMLERGMLAKPNRKTRRANGQKSSAKKKDPIKLDTETKE